MWLTNSSIGRKVIMSVTGIALILFLTFHGCMNVVALISGNGYNMICKFLGSNWYAVAATVVLVALIAIHIIYALILTLQNRKARGNNRYEVTDKPARVEWSSQNMFVLGLIVLLGLILHLFNFWYHMMFAELAGNAVCPGPTNGFAWIVQTFCCKSTCGIIYTILYVIWLAAIWFHLTHGFWSAIQTLGWSGNVWFKRWKVIGNVYVTLVMLMFLAVVVGFASGTAPSLKCAEAPALCIQCACPASCQGGECGKCCKEGAREGEQAECRCEEMKAHGMMGHPGKCGKGGPECGEGGPECGMPGMPVCGKKPLPECCKPGADCCQDGAECCDPNLGKPECCEDPKDGPKGHHGKPGPKPAPEKPAE